MARTWAAHQRVQLVHHADVGQAVIRALRADGIDGMTFNIADDAPVTAFELHELNGEANSSEAAARPPEDPWAGIVATDAARVTLGYAAKDAGAL